MLLLVLLLVPIAFWLIPFARMQQQDKDQWRRFFVNFGSMLAISTILALTFWYFEIDRMLSTITVLGISGIWAFLYHFVTKNKT